MRALQKADSNRPMRAVPQILLVKTSSLGDLVHNLPVVSDLARRFPGCAIDWVAEESFADIPALHPAVRRVHPVALRRWKKTPLAGGTRSEIAAFRSAVRARSYDVILDTQGLIKSAWLACLANGRRAGYDWTSAREPVASLSYHQRYTVARQQHAVERNRQLAAAAFGYAIEDFPLDYGLQKKPFAAAWLPAARPYVVLLTATSRDDKLWDEFAWIGLGRHLVERGFNLVLPAGSAGERERAERLARSIADDARSPNAPAQLPTANPGWLAAAGGETGAVSAAAAYVAPPLPIRELAPLLSAAAAAVGVDTGLTHLAAAAGIPTVALYTATDPGLTGVLACGFHRNLGGKGAAPTLAQVIAALAEARLPV
jgi:heptosyltransferase I